ncbi:MAG: class I SAM-dependent methyltransferase [Euryarchaeota archaeon]|nr:class I SAM-dependent methyltransferase [Euryarchaeota archaeon]
MLPTRIAPRVKVYTGRPGASPVVAGLFAARHLIPGDRILDVGCGTGNDAIALARLGAHVTGIDNDPQVLRVARARSTRLGLTANLEFRELDVLKIGEAFNGRHFFAIVDTLLFNNLPTEKELDYGRQAAQVIEPGGLWVLQWRSSKVDHEHRDGPPSPRPFLRKWFDFGPPVPTLLAEHPRGRRDPPFARVVVWVGVRNDKTAQVPTRRTPRAAPATDATA